MWWCTSSERASVREPNPTGNDLQTTARVPLECSACRDPTWSHPSSQTSLRRLENGSLERSRGSDECSAIGAETYLENDTKFTMKSHQYPRFALDCLRSAGAHLGWCCKFGGEFWGELCGDFDCIVSTWQLPGTISNTRTKVVFHPLIFLVSPWRETGGKQSLEDTATFRKALFLDYVSKVSPPKRCRRQNSMVTEPF